MFGLWNLHSQHNLIRLGSWCFSAQHIAWLKSQRLHILEIIARALTLAFGFVLFFTLYKHKETWLNPEYLLVIGPLMIAYKMLYRNKIASTGDLQEDYDSRQPISKPSLVKQGELLSKENPRWHEVRSASHDYWFNCDNIAWIQPSSSWDTTPLIFAFICIGYRYLIRFEFDTSAISFLKQFSFLTFQEGGVESVSTILLILTCLSIACSLFSIKRGATIACHSGVQDLFTLTRSELESLLEAWGSVPSATSSQDNTTSSSKVTPKSKSDSNSPKSPKADPLVKEEKKPTPQSEKKTKNIAKPKKAKKNVKDSPSTPTQESTD